ncbi:MAG: flagellar basal body L-ring protein FlgH [Desulfobacteraceae bacterium]|nr:flagellar basal body L-ring protein FlgH [Desulfobacteraceae bacterium]
MKIHILWILILCLTFFGCAAQQEPRPAAKNGQFGRGVSDSGGNSSGSGAVRASAPVEETGSLWQQKSGSLYAANKASRVGDILTVAIYEQASAEKESETATDRSSSVSAGIPKLFGYEARLAGKHSNLDPSQLLSASTQNSFQGSGSTSREESLSATLTTRVVDIVQGGNLKIRGSKTVRVNHEDQIIQLTGIVRPSDITERNVIDSKYILDARIEYTGKGVISEKQRPGWLARLFDIAWPF